MAIFVRAFSLLFIVFCTFPTDCNGYETLKKECQNKCELTYSPHTYPYGAYQNACKRGCRFNVILQLSVSNREPGMAEVSCEKACKEAYDDDEEGEKACLTGCKQQKPIPSPSQILQNGEDDGDTYSFISFKPVFYLGSFCQGILDRTSHIVQFSSSYYYSNSDGDSVIIKYESPQIYFQGGEIESHMMISTEQGDPSSDNSKDGESSTAYKMMRHGKNWLHCVSAKSGLPAWLVAGTLLLSSFFLIWLCCATTTTTTKIQAKVLTDDDLFLIDGDEHKIKRIPVSLGDESEAGPLPVKVLIDDSRI